MKPADAGRILGWDLVRGACALVVAFYHLSYWLGLAELPAFGTYGVYLFFVLSGASLAYVYPADRVASVADALRFWATRWLRLAPLYVLLCLVFVAMLAGRNGALVSALPQRLALNATFAFGVWDPATTALLIGGWSLGIEFVFYLAFPLLARALQWRWAAALLFVLLAGLQFAWTAATVGEHGWSEAVVAYHQAPAFAAWFFGGCLLGHWQRRQAPGASPLLAWLAAAAWVATLLLLMPARPGDELLGARGAILFAACFAAVHLCGRARLQGRTATLAAWCGDITYGTYLLHPMLLFGFLWFVADPKDWPVPARWGLLIGVIALACVLAALSERRLERPLRRWGARRLHPRPARSAPQSEAASISS